MVVWTDEKKESPLYKYYEKEIAPVSKEMFEQIMFGTFDDSQALPFAEKDKLFEEGYLPGEFGVFKLPGGGFTVANKTDMPGVRPEMFDWWFAWHGLDPDRYAIWDKENHYYCKTRNPEIALNANLSMKERYWHTTHDVKESMMEGTPIADVALTFLPPDEFGFDKEKLANFDGTIVCTLGMAHFVRPTENGCELRSRFWFDNPDMHLDEMFVRALLVHNVHEYSHLAKILPELYAEFKDKF